MKIRVARELVPLLMGVCSGNAFAAEGVKPYSTENEWSSAQIAAAGGIGSVSDNVVDQFFSDPSIIAQNKRSFILQFFGANAFYSLGMQETISDVTKMTNSKDSSTGNARVVSTLNSLRKIFGRRITGGANVNVASFKIGKFSLIPYVSAHVQAGARVPSWPRAEAVGDAYGGVGLGYAHSFGPKWDVGMNIRPGSRYYVSANGDASGIGGDLVNTEKKDSSSAVTLNKGSGVYVPVDLAVGFNANKAWRLSFITRNLGGSSPLSSTDAKPPVYPMRLNLGTTWTPIEVGVHKVQVATELQDSMNLSANAGALLYRWQWAALYKFKLPARTDTTFGLTTGLQSGYPAIGVFVDLFIMKLEATAYSVEGGAYPGQNPEKRYAFKAYSQLAF